MWIDIRHVDEQCPDVDAVLTIARRFSPDAQYSTLELSAADIYCDADLPIEMAHRHIAMARRYRADLRFEPNLYYRMGNRMLVYRVYEREHRDGQRGTRFESALSKRRFRTILGQATGKIMLTDLLQLLDPANNVLRPLHWFRFREKPPRKQQYRDQFLRLADPESSLSMQSVYSYLKERHIEVDSWLIPRPLHRWLARSYIPMLREFLAPLTHESTARPSSVA